MVHLFGRYRNLTLCLSDREDEGKGNWLCYAKRWGRWQRQGLAWRLGQRDVLGRKGFAVCRYQLTRCSQTGWELRYAWDEKVVDGVDGGWVKV